MLPQKQEPAASVEVRSHNGLLALDIASKHELRDSRFVLLKTRPSLSAVVATDSQVGILAEPTLDARKEAPNVPIKDDRQQAFRLLDDVKAFIPRIIRENDHLRQNILAIKSQAEMEIEAAESRSQEWQSSAEALKGQVEILEAMVLDLKSQLVRSESIVAIEKELSSKAEKEAAEAECLAKLFEDTVTQSFGIGTMFQDALRRLENGAHK